MKTDGILLYKNFFGTVNVVYKSESSRLLNLLMRVTKENIYSSFNPIYRERIKIDIGTLLNKNGDHLPGAMTLEIITDPDDYEEN